MAPKLELDFGALLRSWRTSRNQSQLDLSLLAGVSSRHVSFLETGRARPSREMVLVLGEALDVPLRERNLLLRAAGFADVYAERELGASELDSARRALAFVLARHEPYAALVVDGGWNIQLANASAQRLLGRFTQTPPTPPINVLRLLFDPNGGRPFVENWSDVAVALIQRLHREARETGDGSEARRLLAELLAAPGVPRSFAAPDLSATLPPIVPLNLRRGNLRLSLLSLIASFGTPLDVTLNELRIETFLPADDPTDAALRALAAEAGS